MKEPQLEVIYDGPLAVVIWRTAYGIRYRMDEMSDSHVQNTERMLRGEGEQQCPDSWDPKFVYQARMIMLAELKRRGLEPRPKYPDGVEVVY